MFMAGMTFHVLALLVKIVLGAVALTLACLWTPQRGKVLFCIFVGIAFLAEPLIQVMAYTAVSSTTFHINVANWNTGVRNDQRLYIFIMQIATWSKLLLYLISGILLLVYAAIRYRATDVNIQKASTSNERSLPELGRRWDTQLPASRLVEIARRREWAHAIDCLPAILFFCFFTWVFGSIIFENSRNYRDQRQVAWLLSVLATLSFLVYLLMKDSIGGVSVGKWFTRCRVVDEATGIAASAPQTMLRNAIFLLFPLGSLIELAMANFRSDRKRLGDLWAGTMVVHGSAQIVDGVRVKEEVPAEMAEAPKKHPLDD